MNPFKLAIFVSNMLATILYGVVAIVLAFGAALVFDAKLAALLAAVAAGLTYVFQAVQLDSTKTDGTPEERGALAEFLFYAPSVAVAFSYLFTLLGI